MLKFAKLFCKFVKAFTALVWTGLQRCVRVPVCTCVGALSRRLAVTSLRRHRAATTVRRRHPLPVTWRPPGNRRRRRRRRRVRPWRPAVPRVARGWWGEAWRPAWPCWRWRRSPCTGIVAATRGRTASTPSCRWTVTYRRGPAAAAAKPRRWTNATAALSRCHTAATLVAAPKSCTCET